MKKQIRRKGIRKCKPREILYEIKETARRHKFYFISKSVDIESLVKDLEYGLGCMEKFSTIQAAKFIYLCNLGVTLAEKTVVKRSYLKLKIREIKHEAIKNCQKMNLPIEVVSSKGKLVTYRLDHYRFHAPVRL